MMSVTSIILNVQQLASSKSTLFHNPNGSHLKPLKKVTLKLKTQIKRFTGKKPEKTIHLTKFLFVAHPDSNAHVPLAVLRQAVQVLRLVADVAKLILVEFPLWIRYQNESSSTEP